MAETPPDKPAPLKVVLLAPTNVVGGIMTWARFFLKFSDPARVTYHVIDTSKLFDPLGRKLGLRGTFLGLWDAAKRLVSVVRALRSFRPDLVYFTCAPSIGLTVRDVPYMLLLRLLGVPAVAHLHGGNVRGFFGVGLVRRTITIWGDGNQTRSYCYIDDCVKGIYRLMHSDFDQPLNIGSDHKVSINELVEMVAKAARKQIKVEHDLTKPQGVRGRNSDNTLLRKVLKWEPAVPLEKGMALTYRWIKSEIEKHGGDRGAEKRTIINLEGLQRIEV